jgi:hypothetical protein
MEDLPAVPLFMVHYLCYQRPHVVGLAHLDSAKMGGFIIKLIQHPPDFDPSVGVKYL